jgi:hypothetical protein
VTLYWIKKLKCGQGETMRCKPNVVVVVADDDNNRYIVVKTITYTQLLVRLGMHRILHPPLISPKDYNIARGSIWV